MQRRYSIRDLASVAAVALIWGTTWHAIKLQLGVVDPLVSVIYRFSIASVLLFGWCAIARQPLALNRRQHRAALGLGVCIFTLDYACVYLAETRVASAVVAIMFATAALMNLAAFRLFHGQRAPAAAWAAAALGALGVALLSWGELTHAGYEPSTAQGLGLALIGTLGTVGGNLFALRGERAGAPLAASTAWSMAYGSALLALFVLLSGRPWRFELSGAYVLSLAYLTVFGSVVAMLLYFGVARRRGYTLAAYISAMTSVIAMLMSSLFEGKHWAPIALVGGALVVLGQWLLLRTRQHVLPDITPAPAAAEASAPAEPVSHNT